MKFQTQARPNASAPSARPAPIDAQEVARVAYELYEKRGREDGRDMEDWLRAEAIVRRQGSRGLS